jgi:hypothetical protein
MPCRRCIGESTKNIPPKLSRARPPKAGSSSRSSSRIVLPPSSRSSAVAIPPIPAPRSKRRIGPSTSRRFSWLTNHHSSRPSRCSGIG